MKMIGIKVTALFLAVLMFSMPVLARPNYTYTTVYEEVSTPVPAPVQRNLPPVQRNYQPPAPVKPPVKQVVYTQPVPARPPVRQVVYDEPVYDYYNYPPQGYTTRVVEEHTYIDGREPIDKAIDRTGKVVGILGVGALLGAFATAIFASL